MQSRLSRWQWRHATTREECLQWLHLEGAVIGYISPPLFARPWSTPCALRTLAGSSYAGRSGNQAFAMPGYLCTRRPRGRTDPVRRRIPRARDRQREGDPLADRPDGPLLRPSRDCPTASARRSSPFKTTFDPQSLRYYRSRVTAAKGQQETWQPEGLRTIEP